MAKHTKTLEEYRKTMDGNGYMSYNADEFHLKSDNVCYIPENAETLEDTYSYQDLKKEVEEWLNTEETKEYLAEAENSNTFEENVQSFLTMMWEDLSWESPSTWLAERLM